MGILEQFGTKNYVWRLDIVQNLSELWQFFLSHFSAQNGSIPPNKNMPKWVRYFNTTKLYNTDIYETILEIIQIKDAKC